jgi:hypothetical protein
MQELSAGLSVWEGDRSRQCCLSVGPNWKTRQFSIRLRTRVNAFGYGYDPLALISPHGTVYVVYGKITSLVVSRKLLKVSIL